MKGSFSRRSLGNVVGPWFLFDANFELTPLEPGPAASSWRGLQWRPRPGGGTLRGRLTPRFRTIQVCSKDAGARSPEIGCRRNGSSPVSVCSQPRRPLIRLVARSDHHAGRPLPVTGGLFHPCLRRCRRPDLLRPRSAWPILACGRLRRPYPQRREARRPTGCRRRRSTRW